MPNLVHRIIHADTLFDAYMGVVAAWVAYFLLAGILIFHFAFGFGIDGIAVFAAIGLVVHSSVEPLLFSARRTPQTPNGNYPRSFMAMSIMGALTTCFWAAYLKMTWRQHDPASQSFLTGLIVIALLFGIVSLIAAKLFSRTRRHP